MAVAYFLMNKVSIGFYSLGKGVFFIKLLFKLSKVTNKLNKNHNKSLVLFIKTITSQVGQCNIFPCFPWRDFLCHHEKETIYSIL